MPTSTVSWESFYRAVWPPWMRYVARPEHALRAAPAPADGRVPPGPAAHGPMGNLRALARDPVGFFARAMWEHGDIVRLRLGPYVAYLVSHPDGVREVLQDPRGCYSKQTPGYGMLRRVLGNGLLTSEGEFWRRQRRIAAPAFHRERIKGFAACMARAGRETADRWVADAARGADTVDVAAEMMRVTMQIAAETMFGADVRADAEAVGRAFAVLLRETQRRARAPLQLPKDWPTPANRRLNAALATLDDVVARMIALRRRAETHGNDLLAMLMEARDDETGESMSDQQLRDEVMTVFLAGHETTANALAWTFYLLSGAPDVARRLRAEVREVLDDRDAEVSDLGRLPFTRQVVQEALRLYPPAWMIGRTAMRDDALLGYSIPAGSLVFVSPYALHRHPGYWSSPEGFDPDRFDPSVPEPSRYVYIPFGAGPRICIGNTFAMMEAQLLLATITQRCELALVPGQRVVPQPSITLRPANGLWMKVHPHRVLGEASARPA